MESLWGEASMEAQPPGSSHSKDHSGGTAWSGKEGGVWEVYCEDGPHRTFSGDSGQSGGVGGAGAEMSVMSTFCSRCPAAQQGTGRGGHRQRESCPGEPGSSAELWAPQDGRLGGGHGGGKSQGAVLEERGQGAFQRKAGCGWVGSLSGNQVADRVC